MAVHKGQEGYVKVGANTIAEIASWSLTENAETIDTSSMGDTSRSYVPSLKTASGSLSCHWDETDTTGQMALTVGSEVTLNLYPEGDTTGDYYATMSAIITENSFSASFDGLVEATYGFQVNGVVTWGTAA